ncbi:MAG: hypothetical protein V7641_4250 [Blastocatellia bacterium]
MSIVMDRRQFVKLCGASIVAASSLFPGVAKAKNTAYHKIEGFNEKQERIIDQAVDIAVSRLQDKQIWEKTYQKAKLPFVSDEAIKLSNLSDTPEERKNLLLRQLGCLSKANGPNDDEPAFPNIYIHAEYIEGGSWVGRAPLDTVTIYWDEEVKEFRQRGKFSVTLNSAYVGRDGIYSSVDYWAGTIAHEMLHNLGHQHGDSKSDKNYSDYQINVLDRVVASNGANDKGVLGSYSLGSSSLSYPGCGTNP